MCVYVYIKYTYLIVYISHVNIHNMMMMLWCLHPVEKANAVEENARDKRRGCMHVSFVQGTRYILIIYDYTDIYKHDIYKYGNMYIFVYTYIIWMSIYSDHICIDVEGVCTWVQGTIYIYNYIYDYLHIQWYIIYVCIYIYYVCLYILIISVLYTYYLYQYICTYIFMHIYIHTHIYIVLVLWNSKLPPSLSG